MVIHAMTNRADHKPQRYTTMYCFSMVATTMTVTVIFIYDGKR